MIKRIFWVPLLHLSGILGLVVKRQRHYIGLTSLVILSIVLAVGLVTNASFFAQAVDRVILNQELNEFSRVTGRPPFSTSAYIYPSSRSPIRMEDAEQLADHVAGTLSGEVGLPLQHLGLQLSSGGMMLQAAEDSDAYGEDQGSLGSFQLVYVAEIADRMNIVEGVPLDEAGASGAVVDVWIYNHVAQEMGLHVGETFNIGFSLAHANLPIRLAGFWRATDPEDNFWFGNPDSDFRDTLLVRRQDYVNFIQPMLSSGSRGVIWHIILDDSAIITEEIGSYLAGFHRGLDVINKYLPGVRLNTPPLDPLENFVQRNTFLTILLLGFNLPAFGVLLYFLILISVIVAQWQRRETSIFTSRGMSVGSVFRFRFFEQLLLCLLGLPLGIAFGILIARAMGYTTSFLTFTGSTVLPVSLQGLNLSLAILVLAVVLLARMWPTFGEARQSLLAEERERARPTRIPFWYRYYLDLLLVLPTYYAYDQLTKRGALPLLVSNRPEDIYQDPLLVLIPALFILTISLLAMRLFPLLMRMLDAFAGFTPWLTLHLALRQLGRRGQDYIRPLLLVIISLGMGVYTLSMAASLDQWLIDRIFYRVGADMTFSPPNMASPDGGSSPPVGTGDSGGDMWISSLSQLRDVEGIAGVTRVGDYVARANLGSPSETVVRFLAIDRLEFPLVTWFRQDLIGESLGSLMNRLASSQNGILVSQDFLANNSLLMGDQISTRINVSKVISVRSDFKIVGTYNYFPTVYEDDLPAIIGNFDYLSLISGAPMTYGVWLKLEPGADRDLVQEALFGIMNLENGIVRDTQALIKMEQAKMERVGIYGTLSVGFFAAVFMAVLALLIYSYASLKERGYHFDVLHAVGITRGKIIAQVVTEYSFLTIFGATAGSIIGRQAALQFVPFFRYTGEQGVPLPPLIPIIADQTILQLVLLFSGIVILAETATIFAALYRKRSSMRSPF